MVCVSLPLTLLTVMTPILWPMSCCSIVAPPILFQNNKIPHSLCKTWKMGLIFTFVLNIPFLSLTLQNPASWDCLNGLSGRPWYLLDIYSQPHICRWGPNSKWGQSQSVTPPLPYWNNCPKSSLAFHLDLLGPHTWKSILCPSPPPINILGANLLIEIGCE